MNRANTLTAFIGVALRAVSGAALAGKSSDAYFVKVDRDTTTQNSQASGNKQPSGDHASGLPTGKRQHKPFA